MHAFHFSIPLTVSAEEVNHRNHVGYERYFSYFHLARTAYLEQFGCAENDIYGYGLIITEASCQYKRELSSGDALRVYCRAAEIQAKMIRMQFRITKDAVLCAEGKTANLCYDYQTQEVVPLPSKLVEAIQAYEQTPK